MIKFQIQTVFNSDFWVIPCEIEIYRKERDVIIENWELRIEMEEEDVVWG